MHGKTNKVIRVNFAGGLLGLMFGSHRGKLEAVINKHNADGWNLAEYIPDNPNLVLILFRLIFLIMTLGLWTISTGFILVFEKPTNVSKGSLPRSNMRAEPKLTAK